jgi:hypothetical protein
VGLGFGPTAGRAQVGAPAPDDLSPRLSGPSIHETGRVGEARIHNPGPPLDPGAAPLAPRPESAVRRIPANGGAAAAAERERRAVVDQALLDEEVAARLAALDTCRVEVARRDQVLPGDVPAGPFTLRWRILPDGSVTDTEVVAALSSVTMSQVVDCIKSRMSLWSFTSPVRSPVRTESTFSFR